MLAKMCVLMMLLTGLIGCSVAPKLTPVNDNLDTLAAFGDLERHEGKVVRITGVIKVGAHYICFVDPKFASASEWPREAGISVLNIEDLRPSYEAYVGKTVSIKGTFSKNLLPGGGALLNACGLTGIAINGNQTPEVVGK